MILVPSVSSRLSLLLWCTDSLSGLDFWIITNHTRCSDWDYSQSHGPSYFCNVPWTQKLSCQLFLWHRAVHCTHCAYGPFLHFHHFFNNRLALPFLTIHLPPFFNNAPPLLQQQPPPLYSTTTPPPPFNNPPPPPLYCSQGGGRPGGISHSNNPPPPLTTPRPLPIEPVSTHVQNLTNLFGVWGWFGIENLAGCWLGK